ncbi:disease resistance protein RGA2-like [Eucalyptus grandis]|uniref:disease resistance protein RGA2-like n=1 Tax=Eucalyptus grandis TaxID=71139 RepID=UPI00192EA79A|nr:disease resistance protein RGA2-like [Eucalyptus grandis]
MVEALILRVAKLVDDFPEGGQLWGAGGELSKLKKTFSFLQSIVPDAEKLRFGEQGEIGQWLGNLKDAFYDAEDLLEEWNLEVMQLRESPSKDEKLKHVIPSSSSPSKKPDLRLKMSARAKKIRKRIEAIAARGRDLGLRECAEVVRVERREWLDSFVYDDEIIGREDAKSAIMKFLLDSDTDDQISFFIIRGESGIGKTALARCLYEDDMVKNHFDLRIWVCVGDNFHDLETEVRKFRRRKTTERADDMEQLRKYLLVIDDLRYVDPKQWESLKSLLMGGALGSKILITTSSVYIVDRMSTSPSYCLEALPIESSFDLLMRMACQEEEETRNPTKVDIGRQIVKKCGGIPLAIRMIGSLLFFEKTEAEWSNFKDEIPEFSGNFPLLSSILELSYRLLPCHLRQCFAFCSLFPTDWAIDKQKLTSLWMAAGFIQPIDNIDQDIEDVAHAYFMDLLRRNFFQDCIKDELGNVMSCRMHRSVYDMARHVAGTEYERIDRSWSRLKERTHHILWNSTLYLSEGDLNIHTAYRLRTFIKTSQRKSSRFGTQIGERTLHKLISSFKFLCALDLHDSSIEKLPSSICELKHLTFLDLSENEGIVRLPDSVTRLETLQVLKLNMCYKLKELPRDIRKLVNLRQLEISNCNALSYMPQGMGKLTLLRTLTDFILPGDNSRPENYSGLGELNRLNHLRGSLRIEVKGEIKDTVAESNAANLKEKNSLVSLVLVCAGKEGDEVLLTELRPSLNLRSLEIRGYGGAGFPSWISHMPKLVELRLFHCAACKSLPPLGELTSLKRLEIGALPVVEYIESDLHALSSLPNLSALRIWESPILERIPPLLDLKELESFPVESLQTSFATTEQVIGIDDRVKEVIKLLAIEDDGGEPRMVGIHGTNGIGKTTIVKAVYNRISSCFDSCSFLTEIGEKAQINGGIQFLQTKLIHDILDRDGDVASFEGGIKFFVDVFSNIKALIVLDDVEEQSHLYDLVGNRLEWFGPGSRIIATSENRGILETYAFTERPNIYDVDKMDNDRALELFRRHASIPWYPEIGKRIVKATGQVPFVIEVIGSLLHGKTIEDWRKMEDLIKPHSREILKDCREISKICYEALDDMQEQIFWDIAWFASGVDSQIVSYMWPDLDLLPSYQVFMPLAKIGEDNMLQMHKLLKRLCRTIDQEETKLSRRYMHVTGLEGINEKEVKAIGSMVCFLL